MGMFGKDGKSGDSKRADEAKAREKDQHMEGTPAEKAEALPALVEAAVDRAKEAGASPDRVMMLERTVEKLTGMVETLVKNGAGSGKMERPENLLPKYALCGTCGQYTRLCQGKHRTIRVLPKQAENMEGFGGIQRHGVNYFGMCVVPEAMAEDILSNVANWEFYKRNQRFNLGKVRGWDRDLQLASGGALFSQFQ